MKEGIAIDNGGNLRKKGRNFRPLIAENVNMKTSRSISSVLFIGTWGTLIVSLTLQPLWIHAADQKWLKPTGIVLALHHGDSFREETVRMAEALRTALRKEGHEVTPKTKTEEILRQIQGQPTAGGEEDLLRQAKGHYLQLETRQARLTAERALKIVLERAEKTGDARNLQEIYLVLGLIDLADGKRAEASLHFKNALFLQPDKSFSEKEYSFRVLEFLQKARQEVLQGGTGEVVVNGDVSGADVYVDGVYRGRTPAAIKGLPMGFHFIRVARGAEKEGFSKVELRPDRRRETVSVQFQETGRGDQPVLAGLGADPGTDLRPKLEQFARIADVQEVVLVGLDPKKSFRAIEVIVYDRLTKRESVFQAPLSDPGNFKSEVSRLAARMQTEFQKTEAEKRVAAAPWQPLQEGHPEKRTGRHQGGGISIFKRPAFWLSVALVAAAGGGVGAYFGLKGGGGGGGGSPSDIAVDVEAPLAPGLTQ